MNWRRTSLCVLAATVSALALPFGAAAEEPTPKVPAANQAAAQPPQPAPSDGVPIKIEGNGFSGWIQVQVQPDQPDGQPVKIEGSEKPGWLQVQVQPGQDAGQPVRIEGGELPALLQMVNRQTGGVLVGTGRYATTQPGMGPGESLWISVEQPTEKAAYLGLSTSPPGATLRQQLKLAKGMGLVVSFVDPEGPAKAAGVQQHDVLTKLDDQLVVNMPQLSVLVRSHKPGDTVKLTVIREAKSQEIPVKLTEKDLPVLEEEGLEENEGGMNRPGPQLLPLPGGAGWMPNPMPTPGAAGSPAMGAVGGGNAIFVPGTGPVIRTFGSGAGYGPPAGNIFLADKEYTIQLNVTGPKDTHLTVTEKATGKKLFDGPINTDEQRKGLESLPESVRNRVDTARAYAAGLQFLNEATGAPATPAPAPNPAPAPEKK